MPTFTVPPIGGERPTNPVADTITVSATRVHNAPQPLTVVPAPSFAGDVAGRTWGNWFVEGLTGPPQHLYTGVPTLFESPTTPGLLHIEHVYLKNGSTSETAVAAVSARNMWAGHRGDNMVNPMVTIIPTPRQVGDPELLTCIDLSGWMFHVLDTGRVFTMCGPALPDNLFPTVGGARKVINGTFVDGNFNGPNDVCYLPSNPLIAFVADTFNDRIAKVEETAPGVVEITTFYTGGLTDPYSLYAESDGALIVADRGNNRVVKITQAGVLSVVGTCDHPMVVRPFADGNICVAEQAGTRRLLEMTRSNGALREIDLIRTQQGATADWVWMDVDDHGTCGPVDDIGYVVFSSYQTLKRVSRDGSFKQFVVRGSTLAHGKLSLTTDPMGHYPWAFAFSDRFAKMYFTGGGSSQIRQWRRLHVDDVTTVDAARYKRGADVWNSLHDTSKPSLRLTAGLAGGHNFTGLENVETLDAMSWADFAAWARGGGNGASSRSLTDAQIQDMKYWVKRYARRGLRDATVDVVGHEAPVGDPPPPPPATVTVTRLVAASVSFSFEDIVDDPPDPEPAPDPPLPPPGEIDLDPGIWTQLVVPSRTIYEPRLSGNQSIPEGDPGCAVTLSPNPISATGTMYRSYSGTIAALGKVYSLGGGHAGHPGNDLDVLDIATGTWALQFQSESPPPYLAGVPNPTWRGIKGGATATQGFSPTGKPWCHHTYRLMAVDTTRERLVFLSGNGLGAYKDGEWTQLSGRDRNLNEPVCAGLGGIMYDPLRDSVWCFAGDTTNGLTRGIFEYSCVANTWRRVQSWPGFTGWGFASKLIQAFYAPATREAFLLMSPSGGAVPEFPNRLFRYQLDTGVLTWEQSLIAGTTPYEELLGPDGKWARLADFRTATNQFYCYRPAWGTVAAGFWIFTPATGTWAKLLTPDGPGLNWWTLSYDGETDTFVGLRARTLYCAAGFACGGIADTHLFKF